MSIIQDLVISHISYESKVAEQDPAISSISMIEGVGINGIKTRQDFLSPDRL